jgi:hypothetical protein
MKGGEYLDSDDLFKDRQTRKFKKGWTKKNITNHLQKISNKHYNVEMENEMIEYFKTTGDFSDGPHWFCHDLCLLDKDQAESLVYILLLRDGRKIIRDQNINRKGGCIQPLKNTFINQLVHCGASFQCVVAGDKVIYNAPFQFLL